MSHFEVTYTTPQRSVKTLCSKLITYNQASNFLTLIKILEQEACPDQFDMSDYEANLKEPLETSSSVHMNCGTVACVMGWAKACMIQPNVRVDYDKLADFLFGLEKHDAAWEWLFGGSWAGIDNTVEGAIKRIKYYINCGKVPEWYLCHHTEDLTLFTPQFRDYYKSTLAELNW